MNIVFPMAGQGSRFANAGFALPKPLIDVAGKPMYRHAVDCMPLHLASRLVFVLRKNNFFDQLVYDIQTHYASFRLHIIGLNEETRGQAETVFKSADVLDCNSPTLVHNCDTAISSFNFGDVAGNKKDNAVDGALVLFFSTEKRWSYARLDTQKKKIIEVREKEVISPYASTGTYYFKDTSCLLENIQEIIGRNLRENNEFYLSSVYNIMLQRQKNIVPLWTPSFRCFGTPPDLVESLNRLIKSSIDAKGTGHD